MSVLLKSNASQQTFYCAYLKYKMKEDIFKQKASNLLKFDLANHWGKR